jgi:SAM-dependent methyltransferase
MTNRWRRNRGRLLSAYIKSIAALHGRKIAILDVGGRAQYWDDVDTRHVAGIVVLNNCKEELTPASGLFSSVLGDGCALGYPDKSFDFVHSNSVIEHVGDWHKMIAFADEVMRVGRAGWVQTPAWEFPIEPHFRMPFMHWLAAPARRAALRISPDYSKSSLVERREHADRINLLTRGEVKALFPFHSIKILTERCMFLPKSYTVKW